MKQESWIGAVMGRNELVHKSKSKVDGCVGIYRTRVGMQFTYQGISRIQDSKKANSKEFDMMDLSSIEEIWKSFQKEEETLRVNNCSWVIVGSSRWRFLKFGSLYMRGRKKETRLSKEEQREEEQKKSKGRTSKTYLTPLLVSTMLDQSDSRTPRCDL
ncbi:unnamed protein product [Prunus brigantina]